MKMSNSVKWIIGLSVLLVVSLVIISLLFTRQRELKLQNKTLSDTTVNYKNKYGEAVSENKGFVGNIRDLKAQQKNWEKAGDSLRSVIRSNTIQLTVLKQKFQAAGSGVPDTVFRDTIVYIAGTAVDSSTLNIREKDEFHEFNLSASKKKYAYDFKAFLKTELHTEDMGGAGVKVTAVNRSPYIVESETKSLIVPRKKPSFWNSVKWFAIGAGAGVLAGSVLK